MTKQQRCSFGASDFFIITAVYQELKEVSSKQLQILRQ
ncbi:hypothetical protein CIN_17330 [Commensalibacter intestini A911]|uniref:Uncharacterized protein n=1 Tax=Commensalibacter intestini A911 TaxID=1088868 RepID=G6F287_9PROT|nr:hypothetical protein CIN_17330 [Commensalibacter intestini A911]